MGVITHIGGPSSHGICFCLHSSCFAVSLGPKQNLICAIVSICCRGMFQIQKVLPWHQVSLLFWCLFASCITSRPSRTPLPSAGDSRIVHQSMLRSPRVMAVANAGARTLARRRNFWGGDRQMTKFPKTSEHIGKSFVAGAICVDLTLLNPTTRSFPTVYIASSSWQKWCFTAACYVYSREDCLQAETSSQCIASGEGCVSLSEFHHMDLPPIVHRRI